MTYDPMQDDRLDMRNRALLAGFDEPMLSQTDDATTREEALAAANTPEALAVEEAMSELLGVLDNEDVIPSAGLRITRESLVSHPDGNTINVQIIRPDTDEILPCVYYIHGGGMAILSALDPNYRAWEKLAACALPKKAREFLSLIFPTIRQNASLTAFVKLGERQQRSIMMSPRNQIGCACMTRLPKSVTLWISS